MWAVHPINVALHEPKGVRSTLAQSCYATRYTLYQDHELKSLMDFHKEGAVMSPSESYEEAMAALGPATGTPTKR